MHLKNFKVVGGRCQKDPGPTSSAAARAAHVRQQRRRNTTASKAGGGHTALAATKAGLAGTVKAPPPAAPLQPLVEPFAVPPPPPPPPPPSPPPRPAQGPVLPTIPAAAAAAAPAAAPAAPAVAATGAPLGLVPGRAVLAPAGWQSPLPPPPQSRLRLFAGSSNPALAGEVADRLGLSLGALSIKRFADGEVYVQVGESVRGADVFLVQPTSPPVNDHFMELAIMVDACRRASARSVTAVIPYYGYARADRRAAGRESIAAKLTADLLTSAGVDRALVVDLHSGQTAGYFDVPVDHVAGAAALLPRLAALCEGGGGSGGGNGSVGAGGLVVVSPDVGGVARARALAKRLGDVPLAIVDKRRSGHNVSEVMNLIGDVKGKAAVLVDDMIDTAGTITNAAKVLRQEGARAVYACATHAVFSPPAVERLSSGVFDEVIVTNTIALPESATFPQLTVVSIADVLAEAIWRIHTDSSAADLLQG